MPTLYFIVDLIQASFIILWLASVRDTASFCVIYCIVGVLGFLALLANASACAKETGVRLMNGRQKVAGGIWAIAIGCAVSFSEYAMPSWGGEYGQTHAIGLLLVFVGATVAGWNIVRWSFPRLEKRTCCPLALKHGFWPVFGLLFLLLAGPYGLYMFLAHYPGTLTPDSCSQLMQSLHMLPFDNHHPIFHTLTVSILFRTGRALLGSASGGVAFYSVCQILAVAATFASLLATLYRAGVHAILIAVFAAWFVLQPEHLFFSSVMWKNVMFSCFAVLYLVSLFRLIRGWDSWVTRTMLALSGLGFCLFLTNGLAAFVFSLPVLAFFLRRFGKGVVVTLVSIAVVACLIKYPVLKMLNIQQHNPFEPLTIPVQQVARVLHDGKDISPDERALIELLAPVDEIARAYHPRYNDPVKWMIVKNADEFVKRRGEFIRLWISLGLRYPVKYVKAWIDQTCGYWNGGYAPPWDFQWAGDPDFPGVKGPSLQNPYFTMAVDYETAFSKYQVLQPLISIGFHLWIVLFVMLFAFAERRIEWVLCVPVLAVMLTLCMAAPVNNEFRYAYSLFTCFPLLVTAPFVPTAKEREHA